MSLATYVAVIVLLGAGTGVDDHSGSANVAQSQSAAKAQSGSPSKQAASPAGESELARLERENRELKAASERLTGENSRLRERVAQLESELGRKPGAPVPATGASPSPQKPPEPKAAGVPQPRKRSPEIEKRIQEAGEKYKLEGGQNCDRGRIYIKFGPPDSLEKKDGVEIWRYAEQPGVGKNVEIRFGGPTMKTIWVHMDRK